MIRLERYGRGLALIEQNARGLIGWQVTVRYPYFEQGDMWIGVYWKYSEDKWKKDTDVYVCIVPCVVLHVGVLRFKEGA